MRVQERKIYCSMYCYVVEIFALPYLVGIYSFRIVHPIDVLDHLFPTLYLVFVLAHALGRFLAFSIVGKIRDEPIGFALYCGMDFIPDVNTLWHLILPILLSEKKEKCYINCLL